MTRNNANADADEVPNYRYTWPLYDPNDPETRWVTVMGGDLPCQIEVRLGRPQGGRLACTGLRIGAADGEEESEVTSRMLRDIRLSNVLRALREGMSGVWEDHFLNVPMPAMDAALRQQLVERVGEDVVRQLEEVQGITGGEQIAAKVKAIPAVRRGRRGLDAETLRRTAEVYLEAIEAGSTHPQADAARLLYISVSALSRRLQTAWRRFPELKPKDGGKT